MFFETMYKSAVYTHRFLAFGTFYMKMLRVLVLSETVGGAFSLLAYESGQRSAFDEVLQRSVYRWL